MWFQELGLKSPCHMAADGGHIILKQEHGVVVKDRRGLQPGPSTSQPCDLGA